MITFKSAQQLEDEKQAQIAKDVEMRERQQSPVIDNLARYVQSKWEIAKTHRYDITDRLTDCLRRRRGIYDPQKKADIESVGGSDIYMNITGNKCVGAKAWLGDIFSSDRPFSISPTPIPDLPPEIHEELIMTAMQGMQQLNMMAQQQGNPNLAVSEQQAFGLMKKHEKQIKSKLFQIAEERMDGMSKHIDDVLVEGKWRQVFDDFLDDFVTYPTAIIGGINFRQRKKIKWVSIGGKHEPRKEYTISREFERVSPFDAYPSPTTDNSRQTWFIQHVRYTPEALAGLRKAPGYDKQAIYEVLNQFRNGGRREWLFNEGERDRLEGRESYLIQNYDLIDGIKFSGTVQGKMLIDWGMNPQSVPDPMEEYPVSVICIGPYTIRAIINPDPAGKINYYWASLRSVPGSFWGEALPEMIADTQDWCNATARSLINNMAMASGPMVAYDVSKLPTGQVSPPKIRPWQMFAYDSNKGGAPGPGVSFFMPETKANELLNVYERAARYADEQSGIPQYAFGSDGGAGAAKTASGLSMLMNAASKTMKGMVRNIDLGVIEPVIETLYNTLMLDPSVPDDIKGDACVKARGSDSLMYKEAIAMRQQELLQLTGNQVDQQIFGTDELRNLQAISAQSGFTDRPHAT